jgi:hypothetical protein
MGHVHEIGVPPAEGYERVPKLCGGTAAAAAVRAIETATAIEDEVRIRESLGHRPREAHTPVQARDTAEPVGERPLFRSAVHPEQPILSWADNANPDAGPSPAVAELRISHVDTSCGDIATAGMAAFA